MDRREFLGCSGRAAAWLMVGGCCVLKRESDMFVHDGTLRDSCWLYGHDPGDHDGLGDNPLNSYNVPVSPALKIVDAAKGFGVPNICVCRWGMTDDDYLAQYKDPFVKRLSWAMTGEKDERYYKLVSHNFKLLQKLPNLIAFDLDDYFRPLGRCGHEDEIIQTPHGPVVSAASALPYDELMRLKKRTGENPDRPIALQLVVYDYMLREEMKPVFDAVDIVQYWTWCGKDLASLPERFRRYRQLAPDKPTYLGLYMWDYGGRKPIELAFMKQQLKVGYNLWRHGEVDGFVFHCSNLLNKSIPAAEYARDWFALHADERRETAVAHFVAERSFERRTSGHLDITNLAVTADSMRARRAQLDAAGEGDITLTIGGDEWMPFYGKGTRQLLATGRNRIVLVEPSGRVAWQHVVTGRVTGLGGLRKYIYYAAGDLYRVPVTLPCDPSCPAEKVFAAPKGSGGVVGFDFTIVDLEWNGKIVVLLGNGDVCVVDPETRAVRRCFNAGSGALAVKARVRETFAVVYSDRLQDFSQGGARLSDSVVVKGSRINDGVLLEGGNALVARDEAVEIISPCGCSIWRFDRTSAPGLERARFTSVQRIGRHTVIGLAGNGDASGTRPTALGVSERKEVVWSCASPRDLDMAIAIRLQARRDYN